MKLIKKNIEEAMLPISILNWITGLSIIEYPLGVPKPIISFIYVLILIFIYLIISSSGFQSIQNKSLLTTEQMLFTFIKYVNIFVATSSIILGWFHSKVNIFCRFTKIIETYIVYEIKVFLSNF